MMQPRFDWGHMIRKQTKSVVIFFVEGWRIANSILFVCLVISSEPKPAPSSHTWQTTARTFGERGGVPSVERCPISCEKAFPRPKNTQRVYLECVSRSAKEQDGGRAREKMERFHQYSCTWDKLRKLDALIQLAPGGPGTWLKQSLVGHIIRIHLKQGEGFAVRLYSRSSVSI